MSDRTNQSLTYIDKATNDKIAEFKGSKAGKKVDMKLTVNNNITITIISSSFNTVPHAINIIHNDA